jgi:hypothetical protein
MTAASGPNAAIIDDNQVMSAQAGPWLPGGVHTATPAGS